MGPSELSSRLTFGPGTDLGEAIASLALSRFLTGDEPFACELTAPSVARAADLVPLGSVVRQVHDACTERILAQGDGWSVLVQRYRNGNAEISVSATGTELLAKVVADVRARSPVVEPQPDAVHVEFWYADGSCLRTIRRELDAPAWNGIAGHYAGTARAKVDALASMGPPASGGRLLLWHGPPGTGKTTAIRSLAREWAGWCRTLFVVDPEQFLGRASYLMSVLLGAEDYEDGDEAPTWRLIVIEDADELLRADAKRTTGQSLSRLLNVADGFIGRGLRTLIMITTNEPLGRLHPAVVRPGRCLAEIEFPLLSREEAAALLGPDDPVDGDLSLAEVFELRGEVTHLSSQAASGSTGQYL